MVPFHPTYSGKLETVFHRKEYGLNLEMLGALSERLRTWLRAKSLKFWDLLIMFRGLIWKSHFGGFESRL